MSLQLAFPYGNTPHRRYLTQRLRQKIRNGSISTAEIQLFLLYLREQRIHELFFEWGSSVAHSKRNQGWLWEQAVNTWMLYVFFRDADKRHQKIDRLPMEVFTAIKRYIQGVPVAVLNQNLSHIYPNGFSVEELVGTLEYLYQPESKGKSGKRQFVELLRTDGLPEDDQEFVHWLLEHLEHSLTVQTFEMNALVDSIEDAFNLLLSKNRSFSRNERTLLELHLLAGFHSTLIEIDASELSQMGKSKAVPRHVILTVGTMENVLTLDLGIFTRQKDGYLDCFELIEEKRGTFPKFYQTIVRTDLSEEYFLDEKDGNVRTGLVNHPVEVVWRRGIPKLVARKTRYQQ